MNGDIIMRLYALSVSLKKDSGNQSILSSMVGYRRAHNEDEARGSFLKSVEENKPDFLISQMLCIEIPEEHQTQHVRVGVGVCVNTKNGYVLMKRQGSHGAGEWALPGGKIDLGETIIECAVREVMEEIGMVLEDAEIMPIVTDDFFPNNQYVTLYVHGYAHGEPKIMEPEKASELLVISKQEELPTPLFSGVEKIWDMSFRDYDFPGHIFHNEFQAKY